MSEINRRLAFIAQLLGDDQVAVVSGARQLTYPELVDAIRQCSEWLSQLKGKMLALHAENSIDWVIVDLACQAIDLPCIPLPAFFSRDQIQQCLLSSGADIILSDQPAIWQQLTFTEDENLSLTDKGQYASLFAWQITGMEPGDLPEHTQKITFTSGSTGSPKGVCLSLDHQWQVAQSLADVIGIKKPKHLCLLPLSTLLENIGGVYCPLLCGGTLVLANDSVRGMQGSSRLEVTTLLNCIAEAEPTTMILIPQLLTVLVAACGKGWQPPSSLKFIAVGGGRVTPELLKAAQQHGLPVFQGYGLSECGSVVALNKAQSNHPESVGEVLPHCSITIENSEVVVTGANYLGYMGNPDSWYPDKVYTGDIGKLQGRVLTIEGRKKNILITSFGRNVSPEWVESELMSMPLLSQCVVMGEGKQALCALLSASDHIDDSAINLWIDKVNQTLPDYARIAHWARLEETALAPYMTANGRLQRNKVESAFSDLIHSLSEKNPALPALTATK